MNLIFFMVIIIGNKSFGNYFSVVLILISIILFILAIYIRYKMELMNQSLYYREELFNSLSSSIDDVFVIYHTEKHIVEYVSPNLEHALGISGKCFKKNPFILFHYTNDDFRNSIRSLFMNHRMRSNCELEFEYNNPKDNRHAWFILRIFPVEERQTIIRYVICIHDLTREKQNQLVLKDALMNAQKANEAKKDFLSHISHEIRTPINAILGMTQIAKKSLEDTDRTRDCLDKIMESSKSLIRMVDNILDMSAIDSQKLLISREPFYMKKKLAELANMVSSQSELNKLDFTLDVYGITHDYLMGDPLRLSQVLCNCTSNAIKFTPPGGYIKLTAKETEKHNNQVYFRFIISDNGRGMSEDYVSRIFIPFEQEDSSIAKKYGGSGLGMSITKNLVTLMGGNIHVSSKPGLGTTITIDLSFETPKETVERETVQFEEKAPKSYDFSGHRILVVEDNLINLEITCELLKFTKVDVDTASDGSNALQLFEASPAFYYDIILMDIQMPGLNGYETAKLIRNSSHPNASDICIIAISADSSIDKLTITMERGMNYCVTKPIDVDSFYNLLDKILNHKT